MTGSLIDDETQHPMDPDLLGSEAGFDEAEAVLARTARALPALADARFARGYAGAFDITPDWMPILDESPVQGFWIAAGMSGHGFKLSLGGGGDDGGPREGRSAADLRGAVSAGPVRGLVARGATFVSSYLAASAPAPSSVTDQDGPRDRS